GETRSVIDLPVEAGVENRRILQGVGIAGLVLAEINKFGVGAVAGEPKLKTEKTTACGGCDINIDNAVAHFKVVQNRRSASEEEALAALIFNRFGLSLQIPARGVWGNGERPRRLGMGRGPKEKSKNTKSEMSKHSLPAHMLTLIPAPHPGRFCPEPPGG